MSHCKEAGPIVSVVMPVYRPDFLAEALDSVLLQTYRPLELVVSDDCRSDAVRAVVDAFRAQADFPIVYRHNPKALGEQLNSAAGVALASGEYVKFLHDDDRLAPGCVEALLSVMRSESQVVLASSRRRLIDEDGLPLPDIRETRFPFAEDVLLDGPDLAAFFADHLINFVGEPSAVLCRRSDLLALGDELMSLDGQMVSWVGDLTLYVQLLRQGNLALLAEPLVDYRVSASQTTQLARDNREMVSQSHQQFQQALRKLGWHRPGGGSNWVRMAPITRLKARVFKAVDVLLAIHQASGFGGLSLNNWLAARQPNEVQRRLIDERLAEQGGGPSIEILLVDRLGDAEAVRRSLESLAERNLYRAFSVRVLTAAPESLGVSEAALVALADEPLPRVINQALAFSRADWLLIADAGVEFTVSGLLVAALDLLGAPASCQAVYADEVLRVEEGELGLALRPDVNLDLLLSFPASMARHWLFRRAAVQAAGGFDEAAGEAFELDFQLRLVEQEGLAALGHISEPLLFAAHPPLLDSPAERQVIERHLRARGYPQGRLTSRFAGRYDIDYGHSELPMVSVLIVVEGDLNRLQRCLQTLLEQTAYAHYEVSLLALGEQPAATAAWLQGIEDMRQARLRVLRFAAGVSREAACNEAAQAASGDFLLWLGAGAGILQRDWLQQLLNHGLRGEVGAVGGKLLAADGKVREGGLLLGLGGPVGGAFDGAPLDSAGYMSRLLVDQNHAALSGDCLLLRKTLFLDAGGFDDDPRLSRWAAVDLCLRLQQAGYLNVWTARAQLMMDVPARTDASAADEDVMYQRWLPLLARDPSYNPGFNLNSREGYTLGDPLQVWRPLQAWQPLPNLLAHPGDLHGCGHYRVIQPFNALRGQAVLDGSMSLALLDVPSLERFQPDIILLQRQLGDDRLEAMRRYQSFSRAFKVYELDDYLPGVPMKSIHRKHFVPSEMTRYLRRGLSYVDRFVVSTEPLAEALGHLHGEVRVMRNCLDPLWWEGLSSQRRVSAKPRVGWAGGSSHTGDLELIADVVKELASEVEWVFFGMCPEKLRPYVHEFHPGVPIQNYPAALAALDLDLALAPVEQNLFNECKSNLRLLEYGICGFPVIASDVRCYRGELPATLVKNRFKDWVEAIRMHLADLDASARLGDELQAAVRRDYMLSGDNLERWRQAWLPS
ncbi:Glycosyl transferase family 2 [Pseudomonas panipatensis]|uniref:Glycosyl transferase family 2 n=2 Tax=Pseudomonas panipatensis TaxID=428992 RepID=A0A1G8FQU8_9PSED|nr:Glycosyl transferase family 2 [Pseudomonas panipatensis]SMP52600.1 Glycosyl transferase family 2 [Pseudomonas panipatensis]